MWKKKIKVEEAVDKGENKIFKLQKPPDFLNVVIQRSYCIWDK
jgi:hypothetical protein